VKRCSPVDGSRIAMAPSSNLCKEPLKIVLRVVRKRQCPHNWCHLIAEIRAPAPEPPDDGCRFLESLGMLKALSPLVCFRDGRA